MSKKGERMTKSKRHRTAEEVAAREEAAKRRHRHDWSGKVVVEPAPKNPTEVDRRQVKCLGCRKTRTTYEFKGYRRDRLGNVARVMWK